MWGIIIKLSFRAFCHFGTTASGYEILNLNNKCIGQKDKQRGNIHI